MGEVDCVDVAARDTAGGDRVADSDKVEAQPTTDDIAKMVTDYAAKMQADLSSYAKSTTAQIEQVSEMLSAHTDKALSGIGSMMVTVQDASAKNGTDILQLSEKVLQLSVSVPRELREVQERLEKLEAGVVTQALAAVNSPAATSPPLHRCSTIPCRYFQSGQCSKGDRCRFSHGPVHWIDDGSSAQGDAPECHRNHAAPLAPLSDDASSASPSSLFISLLEQTKEDGFPDALVDNVVSIHGLQSAHDLIGQFGRVANVDHRKRRCGIAFLSAPSKSIKFENLIFPARCSMCNSEVDDLQGCPCR